MYHCHVRPRITLSSPAVDSIAAESAWSLLTSAFRLCKKKQEAGPLSSALLAPITVYREWSWLCFLCMIGATEGRTLQEGGESSSIFRFALGERQRIRNNPSEKVSLRALANGLCTTPDSNIIRGPESGVARLCASHVSNRPSAADDLLFSQEDSCRLTG